MDINKFVIKITFEDILKVEKFIKYGGEINKNNVQNIPKYIVEKNGYLIQLSFSPHTITSDYREVNLLVDIKNGDVNIFNIHERSKNIEDFIKIFEISFIHTIFYINVSLDTNVSSLYFRKRCLISNIKNPENMDRLIAVIDFSEKLEILLFSYAVINYLDNYKFVELKQIEDILNKFLYYGYEFNNTEKLQKLLRKKGSTFDELFMNITNVIVNTLNLCIKENYHDTTYIHDLQIWIDTKISEIERIL